MKAFVIAAFSSILVVFLGLFVWPLSALFGYYSFCDFTGARWHCND